MLFDQFLQHQYRQLLTGIPTIETVAVMLHQEHQLIAAVREAQFYRRRETPQQRWQWLLQDIDEGEGLFGFGHRYNPYGAGSRFFTGQTQGDFSTLLVQQPQGYRDHKRLLLLFVRGDRAVLAEGQAVGFRSGVVGIADRQTRRTGLAIPSLELGEVDTVGVFHGLDEVIAGHGLAVVALEIQVAALAKALGAQQGVDHAHNFRTLFVHGQGVEVGNLDEAVRAHGVGHGACVFGELVGTQVSHILDALDRRRVHVRRETAITVHREAFFQRQLEPVAAGHAVARPVVEVLVGDDGFDALVSGIGRGFSTGQHGAGVEDIEALVFHGAHVEVVDWNDHEDVQVVLATVGLFVPAHGLFQAVHGVLALVDVFRLDIDAQGHFALVHGGKGVFDAPQVTGHQRKQVRRLHERVFPGRPMPVVAFRATGNRVAVGQQHREVVFFGADGGGELAHHVRAVEVIGDLTEALGLALGAEHATGLVQAFQLGVGFRVDAHRAVHRELRALGLQGQVFGGQLVISGRQLGVFKLERQQLQQLTVQHQRRQARAALRVATHDQLSVDQGVVVEQFKGQVRFVDQVLRRLIVLQVDHLRLFSAHGGVLLLMHGELISRVFTNIDDTGIEDQVLALDPQQRAFGNRVLVQVEADDLGGVRLHRVTNLGGLHVMQQLDGLQAKSFLQAAQAVAATVEKLVADGLEVHRGRIALEQGAPVGAVGDLAAQQVFDETGLLTGRNPQDRQRLTRTLVKPAGGQLGGPGNTDLHARRVGQVDDMVGHAELLAPGRITAGALIVVALLGAHDADITLRQLEHARVAITLAVAGLGLAPAVAAMDRTQKLQAHGLADQGVDRELFITQAKPVLHQGFVQASGHLVDGAATNFDQWMASDLNRILGTGADLEAHSCGPM